MAKLSFETYGKTGVRLTYVNRNNRAHTLHELNVTILFEGDFSSAYTNGNNGSILPTDTMKNMVYVLAQQLRWHDIETLARGLSGHFLSRVPELHQVKIIITEIPWQAIGTHDTAFVQQGPEQRITELTASRTKRTITSGFHNLEILKTADSGFSGFVKDEFTTLPETDDRLFGTSLNAQWTYTRSDLDFNNLYKNIQALLLNTFAEHRSLSVQHTLFAMAEAVLGAFEVVGEIHLIMPNRHRIPVDLTKFGLENSNQVFIPITEPSGYIEARVTRD